MEQPLMNATAERVKQPDRGKPGRKFGLLDAMILVGAAAAGAPSIRPFLLYGRGMPDFFREFFPALGPFVYTAYSDEVVKFLEPWLASWTLAFLAIRLRKPRPRFRRLMRQPGMVACVAATVVMAVGAALATAVIGTVGIPPLEDFYLKILPPLFDSAAIAVVAVWSAMALARRWKPEPGWIDRMGRVIGALWIIVYMTSSFFAYLLPAVQAKYAPPVPLPKYAPPVPSPVQAAMQERLLEDLIKAQEQRAKDLRREREDLERKLEKLK